MTEAEAYELLEYMTAADAEPTLSVAQLERLMELAKREDTEGVAPTDDEWEPTFDLDAAAAEGWRWKAGQAAPRFGVSLDGDTLHRQQLYVHCLKQAEMYAHRVMGSIGVKSHLPPVTATEVQVET